MLKFWFFLVVKVGFYFLEVKFIVILKIIFEEIVFNNKVVLFYKNLWVLCKSYIRKGLRWIFSERLNDV